MILDTHCHLGRDVVYDFTVTEEQLLSVHSAHGITGGIVQPTITRPYLSEARPAHDRIRRFADSAPGTYWGMVSLSPHFSREDYLEEVHRCIKRLHFVGIKLTPNGHAVDILSEDAHTVYEAGLLFHVPVMVHTGMGLPFADPARLRRVAVQFPELKLIIAHAGSDFFLTQAIDLALDFENVYLEPSGVGIEGIEAILEQVPAEKIMFSTDVPVQTPSELLKYRALAPSRKILEQIFWKTAASVFSLDIAETADEKGENA